MGLFDQLSNLFDDAQSNPLLSSLSGFIDQQGGVSGLVSKLQSDGLSDVVSSWVSTGENLPVSAEQLKNVLGDGAIASLAQQAGLSPETVGEQLSSLLPQVVDKLTPGGALPDGVSGLMGKLGSLFD